MVTPGVSTRQVARGAMWNLIGRLAPVPVAIAATPALVAALGDTRWRLFTLAIGLTGAFGVFDLGLGRALTRAVAARVAAGEARAALVATGLLALTVPGLLGGGALALGAGAWVRHGIQLPAALHAEATLAVQVLCASAPLVVLNVGLWGVIAAYGRFRAANLINLPVAVAYYLGPLVALRLCDSLAAAMLALLACRLVVTLLYLRLCLRLLPGLWSAPIALAELRPLLRVGGWMTVSALAFPVLQSADRLVIAGVLSAAESGYYATPFDLIARLAIVPIAVMQSAFPALAGVVGRDPAAAVTLFRRGILGIVALLLPACAVAVAFSTPMLDWWLGPAFAAHAGPVLRWLGIGVLFGAIDGMVAGLIDAIGRPDSNAKLSIGEMVLYLPLLAGLLILFGIQGAAIAWTGRCALDLAVRLALARRLYPAARAAIRRLTPLLLALPALLAAPLLAEGMAARAGLVAVAGVIAAGMLWHFALAGHERSRVLHHAAWPWRPVPGS